MCDLKLCLLLHEYIWNGNIQITCYTNIFGMGMYKLLVTHTCYMNTFGMGIYKLLVTRISLEWEYLNYLLHEYIWNNGNI